MQTILANYLESLQVSTFKTIPPFQAKVQVNNGMIESEWISNNGEGLVPGTYSLRITSQAAMIQPDSVQNIIGKQGENLEGEFVLSEDTLGKMIGYTYAFSTSDSLTAAIESETIWDEVNGYLATGQYTLITDFIDKLQTPFNDYVALYRKNQITSSSFAYYKTESVQTSKLKTVMLTQFTSI